MHCNRLIAFTVFSLFVGLHILISANTLRDEFPNVDELAHLPAGVSHWHLHNFDLYRVNPPLVRTIATAGQSHLASHFDWRLDGGRPEFTIGLHAFRSKRLGYGSLFNTPKYLCLLFPVFGFVLLFIIVKKVAGQLCALVAVGFWSFCPNLIAWGHSLCPDVGMTVVGLAVTYSFWRYVQRPGVLAAGVAGMVLGLALLTKLTWITGLISFPLVICLCGVVLRNYSPRSWLQRSVDIVLIWCSALLILNAGYQFEGSFQKLGDFQFRSAEMKELANSRFAGCELSSLPMPFPKNFVLGVDYLKSEVEEKMWSFLNGRWRLGAWRSYYLWTVFYKTPEPTLIGACIGLLLFLVACWRKMVGPELMSLVLLLTIPAAVCFITVSLQGGFNHHHRYVLMVYPPLCVFASLLASPIALRVLLGSERTGAATTTDGMRDTEGGREVGRNVLEEKSIRLLGGRVWSAITGCLGSQPWPVWSAFGLLALSIASSLSAHPFYVTYFNSISGGPSHGWRLLGHSNIDWGQNLLRVNSWIQMHPECRPLVFELDYFDFNGDVFDLPSASPLELPKDASIDEVRRSITETQWWIISVKKLYNLPGQDGLEYLQRIEPVENIAYSYHVYRIDPMPTSQGSPELHRLHGP